MRFQPRRATTAIVLFACMVLSNTTSAADPWEATDTCPTTGLSVYFASGDAPVSDEAKALLGKLRDTAAACHPERIDLMARFDSQAYGADAELRARSKLALLVNVLMDAGVDGTRIFVSTSEDIAHSASNAARERGRLHTIEVIFNRTGDVKRWFAPNLEKPRSGNDEITSPI